MSRLVCMCCQHTPHISIFGVQIVQRFVVITWEGASTWSFQEWVCFAVQGMARSSGTVDGGLE